ACGMTRFVSPFQGYRAESNPYPGRRSAAVAATLCPGLICGCPYRGENANIPMITADRRPWGRT
ncbi:MAG: hypothetical protein NTY19_24960, partial [Planctomycetota bacterium]|nr:hypothetical protein [Planctomycetota bacterium]